MGKRRDQLNAFYAGMKETNKRLPAQMKGFNMLHASLINNEGVLDKKAKELMSVAIACYARCENCIVTHVYQALKCNATEEEILEAGMVAVLFGGGPTIGFVATVLSESVSEFSSDFIKE